MVDNFSIDLMMFDVDGVLIDTLTDSYETDKVVIREFGGKVPTMHQYRAALANTDWDSFYQGFGIKQEHVKAATQRYYELLPIDVKPTEHAEYTLRNTKRPKAIISKYKDRDKLLVRLDSAGLLKHLDHGSIYAVTDSKILSIIKECDRMNIPRNKAAYVGDSVADIAESLEAKVNPIALSNDQSYCNHENLYRAGPRMIISDLRQILPYVK